MRQLDFAMLLRLSALLLSNLTMSFGYEIKQLWHNFVYNGQIADFGDYDGNGQLDAISYYTKGHTTTVCIYTVSNDSGRSEPLETVEIQGTVEGVVGVDINMDSALDILVILKESKDKYRMLALYQDKATGRLGNGWNSTGEINPNNIGDINGDDGNQRHVMKSGEYEYTSMYPLVLDINGDGYVDILCQTQTKKLFVWTNQGNALLPFLLEHVPFCRFDGLVRGYIPSPHSSAFVDIDGDCRADLVLLVQYEDNQFLQIWQSTANKNHMSYVRKPDMDIQLPKYHGQVSFVDIDGDGTIDIAVPYCTKVDTKGACVEGCGVAMTFNHQKPFCSYIWNNPNSDMCRKATELCSKSEFNFKPLHNTPPVSISLPQDFQFEWSEKHPTTLSFGDLNNNGYPDLIVLARDRRNSKPVVMVYENLENKEPSETYTRRFELSARIDVTDLELHELRITAIDLFEDGITEIGIFASKGSAHSDAIGRFYTVVNESIGLFMKAMVKGISHGETPSSVNVLSTGSNVNGAVFKITVIDVYGAKSPRCSTIRPQSAHSPLLPPYSMFGLGKTNNYVEEFYLGMPSKSENYSNMWISIIPNCSVVAIPHRLSYPNEWTLKLSLSPSKDIYKIYIATLICLVSLGVIIVGFDIKEKREDSEQEKGFRQKFIIN
ncbi:T-cell immunomodulatory -like protein [Babesia sp. Xinjiang]|uniref:T-cell immunomodulatory -like protein n=1 Tax=Babesia sp. Xinjiang TaxID=462227 RepID=UPI000A21BAD6|nr:T-cell immunomodulatory -like protein [Babesia sp. Xinjiang]ORM40488.1 T-cell immunomodulatory -like protein [Babesia sp. Xinjiang]